MINICTGNLLECKAQVLVNTVNTQGIMGKGIALQFKKSYPEMFSAYEKACKKGLVQIGKMHIYETGFLHNPRYIINFPTKSDWRKPSKREYIEDGLKDLCYFVNEKHISSLALPPLGCGFGGLPWFYVRELIEIVFMGLPSVQVYLYAPGETPSPEQQKNIIPQKPLTKMLSAIILALHHYGIAGYESSWIEVQKLCYFLQCGGQALKLRYEKGKFGPYADNLRHVMNKLEGHYILGFGDGTAMPTTPIRLLPGTYEAACDITGTSDTASLRALEKVSALIEGFESAYGLELLATVHWLIAQEGIDSHSVDDVIGAVRRWSERKAHVMKAPHIKIALEHLQKQGWV